MNHLPTFLKGFAMGVANVIPGVSGGTIAFVTGIYERLINSIKSFDGEALKLLAGRKIKELWKHVDGSFLLALMLGVIISIVSLAKVLEVVLQDDVYKIYVSALFFGLILASVWSVYKMVKQWSGGAIIGLLIGSAIAIALAFMPQAQESKSIVYLLICGVVAMCSMIIPGVSGSFVLLLMGNYKLIMVDSVNALRRGEMEALSVLIPVGIGAVAGMAVLSRVLSWLFKRFHDIAVASITGFVAGSLVTIWPWKKEVVETFTSGDKIKEKVIDYDRYIPAMDSEFWVAIGFALVGVVLMVAVEIMGSNKDKVKS